MIFQFDVINGVPERLKQSLSHYPDTPNAITFWTASKSAAVFNANVFQRASEERFVGK